MGKKKCVICGNFIEANEETVPYKSREAHVSCFNNMVKLMNKEKKKQLEEKAEKEKQSKPKKIKDELKNAMTEEEFQDKQLLLNYIREITNETEISVKNYTLIKRYIDGGIMTYKGIYDTLSYVHNYLSSTELKEKGIRLNKSEPLGIVPYMYDEARKVFMEIKKANTYNTSSFTEESVSSMYKTVTYNIKQKPREIKQINLEEIGVN